MFQDEDQGSGHLSHLISSRVPRNKQTHKNSCPQEYLIDTSNPVPDSYLSIYLYYPSEFSENIVLSHLQGYGHCHHHNQPQSRVDFGGSQVPGPTSLGLFYVTKLNLRGHEGIWPPVVHGSVAASKTVQDICVIKFGLYLSQVNRMETACWKRLLTVRTAFRKFLHPFW